MYVALSSFRSASASRVLPACPVRPRLGARPCTGRAAAFAAGSSVACGKRSLTAWVARSSVVSRSCCISEFGRRAGFSCHEVTVRTPTPRCSANDSLDSRSAVCKAQARRPVHLVNAIVPPVHFRLGASEGCEQRIRYAWHEWRVRDCLVATQVSFCSAAGMRTLLTFVTSRADRQVCTHLVTEPTSIVHRALRLTGLINCVSTFDTLDHALDPLTDHRPHAARRSVPQPGRKPTAAGNARSSTTLSTAVG